MYVGPTGFPLDLRIISQQCLSVTFQWNKLQCEKSNGQITGYEYELHTGSQTISGMVDPDETTYTASLQNPGSVTFSVAAVNKEGVGDHCPPILAIVTPNTGRGEWNNGGMFGSCKF